MSRGGPRLTKLRRRPGRPAMGSAPAESFPVRLEPELRRRSTSAPPRTTRPLRSRARGAPPLPEGELSPDAAVRQPAQVGDALVARHGNIELEPHVARCRIPRPTGDPEALSTLLEPAPPRSTQGRSPYVHANLLHRHTPDHDRYVGWLARRRGYLSRLSSKPGSAR